MAVVLKRFIGADINDYVSDLARLRMDVFRSFPYLYDGDMGYEAEYIQTYSQSPRSLFVLAIDAGRVVGAATGIPMADETEAFRKPFVERGYDPDSIFYFGESVLLPEYRGQGIGVAFFEQREGYADELGGFTHCCFCAVERPLNHPLRPADYQALDDFWRHRGYEKKPELTTEYRWKDVGQSSETAKTMTFWMKKLNT
ncbi:GNAT family N-acetyltransferase [Marinobacter sp. CHS3-4]|uniref:GNAT family N-acetyltransferase n=1 Tax=Marinobacter sp. CHS3-4 TaxID=3045174 RepID=UPI0024B4B273|nr:GNAT family N-acetyltransferase [Marinobacter sp. CHS3-4]MDI9245277.1 GNAT family N-acetyltransferase [Marinobacter sp. CHS3-4]